MYTTNINQNNLVNYKNYCICNINLNFNYTEILLLNILLQSEYVYQLPKCGGIIINNIFLMWIKLGLHQLFKISKDNT